MCWYALSARRAPGGRPAARRRHDVKCQGECTTQRMVRGELCAKATDASGEIGACCEHRFARLHIDGSGFENGPSTTRDDIGHRHAREEIECRTAMAE